MKNKILLITAIVVILMVTILVGSPVKDNVSLVRGLLVFVASFLTIFKLKKKTPIITNKIDMFVILLMFSCFIPLIFGTYASLEDTIVNILTVISLVAIYFMVKELKEKDWFVIRNVIIISGVIFFILGLDNLTGNVCKSFLNNLGVLSYRNGEERLIGNIGYANTIGIIMAFMYLISIDTFVNGKNTKLKILFSSTSFMFLSGILLSESKGSILALGIIYIAYFFLNKKAKNKAQIIVITVASLMTSFIYYILFSKFKNNELIIWLSLVIIYVFTILLLSVSKKLIKITQKSIYKIDIKKTMLILIIIVLVFIITFVVLLQFTSPLVLYNDLDRGEVRRTIRGVSGNNTYNISFEITAKSNIENDKVYEISIDEENKYDQVIAEHKIYFGNFVGTKEISIYTDKDTNKLTLRFNKLEITSGELKVNKFTINDKEIPLDYKFIPAELVNNIQSITMENKNIWERGVFIVDGIKLANKNWLFGIGGNGWEHLYKTVQSYSYDARYSHCYLITLFIENGILGVVAFLGIIVFLIKTLYKNRKNHICVIISLLLLLLLGHSLIDFDMEFYCIQVFVFLVLGIISTYEQKERKGTSKLKKISNNVLGILLITIFIISLIENGKILYVNNKLEKIEGLEKVDIREIENLEKILPYSLEVKENRLSILDRNNELDKKAKTLENILKIERYYDSITWYIEMSNIGIKIIENGDEEKGISYVKKAIENLETRDFIPRLDIDSYKYACSNIEKISKKLESISSNKEIVIKNYKKIIEFVDTFEEKIKDYETTRKSKMKYLENKMVLERYRENAEKYVWQNAK